MTDSLTTTLRLTQPTPGGDSGTWPNLLNSDLAYIDEAINQTVIVSVADVNFALVADGTGSDQARYATYDITGAWTANRTITLPANQKIGRVINGTTGGHNVVLSAGAATLSIPPSASLLFTVDGSNNVVLQPGWQTIATYTASGVGSVVIPLPTAFRQFKLIQQKVWTAAESKILGIQLSFDGGATYKNSQYQWSAMSVTLGGIVGGNGNTNDSILPISPGLTNAFQNGWGATTNIFPGSASNTASVYTAGFGLVAGPTYLTWTGGGTYGAATGLANFMALTRADGGNFSGTFILEGLA